MSAKVLNFQEHTFKWRFKTSPGKIGQFPNSEVSMSTLQAVVKDNLPLFDLSCSLPDGIGLIVADFDELPPGFETWEECRKRLQEVLDEKWCVTTSPSRKAKAFCLAQRSDKRPWDQKSCHDFLDTHLPESVKPFYDKKGAAFSFCFMNQEMFTSLERYLQTARPVNFSIKDADGYIRLRLGSSTPTVTKEAVEEEIDTSWLDGQVPTNCPHYSTVLAYLKDNTGRLRDGRLEIIQNKVADLLGLTRPQLSDALRFLKRHGILRITDSKYVPGATGMKYGFGPAVTVANPCPTNLGERSGYKEGLLIVSKMLRQGKTEDEIINHLMYLETLRPSHVKRRGEHYWQGIIDYVLANQ